MTNKMDGKKLTLRSDHQEPLQEYVRRCPLRFMALAAIWLALIGPPVLAQVDVITDCGAVGDDVTDDFMAIQQCLDNNRGQTIVFTKTQPIGSPDYFVSQTLTMKGLGQKIHCESAGGSEGQVMLKFPSGVTGIVITQADLSISAPFAAVEGCSLHGGDPWIYPGPVPVGQSDGIRVSAHGVKIADVGIYAFARHGVNINTRHFGGNANNFLLERVRTVLNRGNGFLTQGGDVNAGVMIQCGATDNQGWGFEEDGFLGNTYIATLTEGNIAGGYKATQVAGHSTFLGIYSEADQGDNQIASAGNLVIGGTHGAGFNYSLNPFVMIAASPIGTHATPFYISDSTSTDVLVLQRDLRIW